MELFYSSDNPVWFFHFLRKPSCSVCIPLCYTHRNAHESTPRLKITICGLHTSILVSSTRRNRKLWAGLYIPSCCPWLCFLANCRDRLSPAEVSTCFNLGTLWFVQKKCCFSIFLAISTFFFSKRILKL